MESGQVSDRWEKRKYDAETSSIIRKAKKDMGDWMISLGRPPGTAEVKAFQAGYISGINRATGNKDK